MLYVNIHVYVVGEKGSIIYTIEDVSLDFLLQVCCCCSSSSLSFMVAVVRRVENSGVVCTRMLQDDCGGLIDRLETRELTSNGILLQVTKTF